MTSQPTWVNNLRQVLDQYPVKDEGELLTADSARDAVEFNKSVFIGNLQYSDSRRPAAVVRPRTAKYIGACLKFCQDNKVNFAVKCGGHSYAGFCLSANGLVIDLRYLSTIKVDVNANVISMQSGSTWLSVYKAMEPYPTKIFLGGMCPSVGCSGYLLGGGLSPFSRSYGIGADSVLEVTMVLADGTVKVLNGASTGADGDLFWAVRGGGGGNFGIVTEFKLRLFTLRDPSGFIVCGNLSWAPEQRDDFTKIIQNLDTFDDSRLCIDPVWHVDATGTPIYDLTIIFNGNQAEAYDALRLLGVPDDKLGVTQVADTPARMCLTPRADGTTCAAPPAPKLRNAVSTLRSQRWRNIAMSTTNNTNDWNPPRETHMETWEEFEVNFDPQVAVNHNHVSFVLPRGALKDVIPVVLDLIAKSPALVQKSPTDPTLINTCHILWDHIGAVTSIRANTDTAFYWRQGAYVMTAKVQWSDNKDKQTALNWTDLCKKELTKFTVDGNASYLNYIDPDLQNWEAAYYGKNYARLQSIKNAADPKNLFKFEMSIRPPVPTIVAAAQTAAANPAAANAAATAGTHVAPAARKAKASCTC